MARRSPLLQDWQFLLGAILLGLALRLDLLLSINFTIDADEAIVGLMAKHILEGKGVPVFYYGQHYMGSLESILTAGLFALCGVSAAALKAVPLLFSLALIVLVYALGLEVGKRSVGRIAAILTALPPAALVDWSSKARGGFIEVLVIGGLAFFFLIRWLKEEKPRIATLALTAFLLGVGWWVNNQIIYFIIPVGFAVLSRCLSLTEGRWSAISQSLVIGVAGFIAGGLPFWVYNLENEFVSFEMFRGAPGGTLSEHIGGLFSTALPILFGAKRFWHNEELFTGSFAFVWGLYLFLFVAFLLLRRRAIARLFLFNIDRKEPLEIFLLLIVTGIAIFTLSSFGYLVQAPRYLLPIYVGVYIVAAFVIVALHEQSPRGATLLFCGLLGINLMSSYFGGRAIPGEPFVFGGERVSRDQRELVSWLTQRGYGMVRTNYWIGYRLAFDTGERIRFKMFRDPYRIRIASYEKEALSLDESQMPYVLVPSQGVIVREALDALGYRWDEVSLSGYVVIYNQKRIVSNGVTRIAIDSKSIRATSTHATEEARMAIDGDEGTRWGSHHPQTPGMTFSLELSPPRVIKGISWTAGRWGSDYPRELRLSLLLASGEERELLSTAQLHAVNYLLGEGEEVKLYFNPLEIKRVIFRQVGSDPVFDWSIAELNLFS